MIKVYSANSQKELDQFISNTMNTWHGWAFEQVDIGLNKFPTQFIIATDAKIKLATIHLLH